MKIIPKYYSIIQIKLYFCLKLEFHERIHLSKKVQEATVKTGHRTRHCFQIGKGVCQSSILSSCIFNLCAEYIMWNSGLEEAQAGIKIAGRNINNLRYADDTTVMPENEETQRTSWWKSKGRVKKLA